MSVDGWVRNFLSTGGAGAIRKVAQARSTSRDSWVVGYGLPH